MRERETDENRTGASGREEKGEREREKGLRRGPREERRRRGLTGVAGLPARPAGRGPQFTITARGAGAARASGTYRGAGAFESRSYHRGDLRPARELRGGSDGAAGNKLRDRSPALGGNRPSGPRITAEFLHRRRRAVVSLNRGDDRLPNVKRYCTFCDENDYS